jgi:hypothetical protein
MKIITFLFLALIVITFSSKSQNYQWEFFGNMSVSRAYSQALPINDTLVLVMGGLDNGSGMVYSSCEFIDVKNKIIKPAPSMIHSRWFFKALLTKDSNIVVIGGSGDQEFLQSVELYNINSNQWSELGSMVIGRFEHSADFINDHEILIVGGRSNSNFGGENTTEIFNMITGLSKLVSNYPMYANDGTVVRTSQNQMWAFGARDGGADSYRNNIIYEYDYIKNTWSIVCYLKDIAQNVSCFKLDDRRVFISGGCKSEAPVIHSNQVMIEENGSLTNRAFLKVPREWQSHAQIGNEIFIIGGIDDDVNASKATEIFNIITNEIESGPDMIQGRGAAPVVKTKYLQQGKVKSILVIGGVTDGYYSSRKSVEILNVESNDDSLHSQILSKGCINAEFEVDADLLITDIVLDQIKSQNVRIDLSPNPPAKQVKIKVNLIDNLLPGYFTINITSSTGILMTISDSLINQGNILEIKNIINNTFYFDSIHLTQTQCKKITLFNNSNIDLLIKNPYLFSNMEFSIPQYQLPIEIKPYDSSLLEICYTPTHIDQSIDTLQFLDYCINKQVIIIGVGLSNLYFGKSKCSVDVNLQSDSIVYWTIGSDPFQSILNIEIIKGNYIYDDYKKINVFDTYGNDLTDNTNISFYVTKSGEIEIIEYKVNINNLINGLYFIRLHNKFYKFFVLK